MYKGIRNIVALALVVAGGAVWVNASEEAVAVKQAVDQTDAYVLETVTPKYPTEMLERGVQGRTLLKLRVDEHGEVSDVRVVASSNKQFSEAAIKSVSKWYFQPGTLNGQAVPQIVTVPVDFEIEGLQIPSIASL